MQTREVVGTDSFMVTNKMLLCIVDYYYSKFPIVKKEGSLADEHRTHP